MHGRFIRTGLAVLTTVGILTTAAVGTAHRGPSSGHSPTTASEQLQFRPGGVFGWD
jgi:hypothetical protein